MIDIDKILIPHMWYLYEDQYCRPALIQFQYKTKGHNVFSTQDSYIFRIFGPDQELGNFNFPTRIVVSDLKNGYLKPIEINLSFMDLFK